MSKTSLSENWIGENKLLDKVTKQPIEKETFFATYYLR